MAERSEEKEKYEFTDNLNDITDLLEEMVEQDKLLITRSSSNLNKCDSEQLILSGCIRRNSCCQ